MYDPCYLHNSCSWRCSLGGSCRPVGRQQQEAPGYAIHLPVIAVKQALMAQAGVDQAGNGPKICHET
jgi:hypothetical protein